MTSSERGSDEEDKGHVYLGPSPVKRARTVNTEYYNNRCIICLKTARKREQLVTSPSDQGKTTLLKRLKEKDDETYRKLQADDVLDDTGFSIPIRYHRTCYQTYTYKREDIDVPTTSGESSHRLTRSGSSPFDTTKCVFCSCYKKHGDNSLINVSTFVTNVLTLIIYIYLQDKIQNAAEALNDQELLVKVKDRDLIALETKYHKNCLSTYIFKSSRNLKEESTERVDVFAEAFEKLITEIKDVFSQGGAFDMSYLLTRYKTYLIECGYQNAESYSAQRLKARIEKYFEGKVIFHSLPKKNEPELVYSSCVDLKKTINKICDMKCQVRDEAIESDLTVPDLDADKLSLFNEALRLRKSVRMVKGISLSPCMDSGDISDNKAEQLVPDDLHTFLCLLVVGKTAADVREAPHLHRRVMAIAQDIVYSASHSRCKTPKHVGLAISLKHLTGSRQVIDLVHSQGHSIGYDDVSKIESAIANKVVNTGIREGEHFLPTNIISGVFSHAAMDNIDINEETRSGMGTTHVLGSLIYQEEERNENTQECHLPNREVREISFKDHSRRVVLECPNKFKRHSELRHLLGKVDTKSWFGVDGFNMSLDRCLVFARLCPTHIYELDIKPLDIDEQHIPSWKGFHAILSYKFVEKPGKTLIGYNPIVPGIPTEWNTIYTGLKLIQRQMQAIGQQVPVTTFDLQLYIIAQEIRFRNWDELGHHVIRLGGFHIMELYWKVIGKRFNSSGIEDLLVEADVFGPNAISVIMLGKNYKRCTLAHKLMFEVMSRLQMIGFLSWLVQTHKLAEEELSTLEEDCSKLQTDMKSLLSLKEFDPIDHARVVQSIQTLRNRLQDYNSLYEEFLDKGQKSYLTFAFWEQYMQDVGLGFDYIAAEREADWQTHLKCFAEIVCYAFAYDRHNYARWGPVYISEMMLLPETAPNVHSEFQAGKHVVTRSTSTSFNSVWSDLGLEQTVVKDTKSKKAGIIGFSRQREATMKWYLTVHERSSILLNFKMMCGLNTVEQSVHSDIKAAAIRKDEIDIQKVLGIIMDRFGNPFILDVNADMEVPDPLTNIATGIISPDEITQSLLQAKEIGKKVMTEFIEERLNTASKPLSAPIKKLKLKTFASIPRKNSKGKRKINSLESDRDLFGRLVVIYNERTVNLEHLFQYELSTIPLAIAENDGSLAKTNKAQIMRDLEGEAASSLHPEEFMNKIKDRKMEIGVFIDHMACVQKISSRTGVNTFGELLDGLELFIKSAFTEGNTVHVVSDRYDLDESIKTGERKRRGNVEGSPEISIHSQQQIMPRNIKTYLANPKNKDNFNDFAFTQWLSSMPGILNPDQRLILAGGFKNHERVDLITCNGVEELDELYSSQDEADTRLILHISDSKARFGTTMAIIWSPDTDVFVLAIYFNREIGIEVWFKTGTKKQTRFIPIHTIAGILGSNVSALLLPVHILTGCDSTSCFKGKGKKKALHLIRNNSDKYLPLLELGTSLNLTDEVKHGCETFVCSLYAPNTNIEDINVLRYKTFCKKPVQNQSLPPCKDSLMQHIKRSNYQCAVWKGSLVANSIIDGPCGNGWRKSENCLEPELMTQESAPTEITELTTCKCRESKCATQACRCVKSGLKCTLACLCEGNTVACINIDDSSDEDVIFDDLTDLSDSDSNYCSFKPHKYLWSAFCISVYHQSDCIHIILFLC